MKKDIPIDERIIFALDVSSREEAIRWVDTLGEHVRFFKVGLELFLTGCWSIVDEILSRDFKVMLDLKFFDIPETVKRAVKKVSEKNVFFTTVHGNGPIIKAANEAKGEVKLLAVTVLTSFDDAAMRKMGFNRSVEEIVLEMAREAIDLGSDGVVASAREAHLLRKELGEDFFIVTPGIRPDTGKETVDDQKRITTPFEAIKSGADYLVIGRPIREAKDPFEVINLIKEDIKRAL